VSGPARRKYRRIWAQHQSESTPSMRASD
jgi:hypothetical protein